VKPKSKSQEKPKKLTQIPDLFNPYICSFEILAATRAELASLFFICCGREQTYSWCTNFRAERRRCSGSLGSYIRRISVPRVNRATRDEAICLRYHVSAPYLYHQCQPHSNLRSGLQGHKRRFRVQMDTVTLVSRRVTVYIMQPNELTVSDLPPRLQSLLV
jgi:hypothetical protein